MAESAHNVVPDGGKKRDEDSEDGLDYSPFWGIEKGAVLQEARCFNESQLDARRCQQVCIQPCLDISFDGCGVPLDFFSLCVFSVTNRPTSGHHEASVSVQPGRHIYKGDQTTSDCFRASPYVWHIFALRSYPTPRSELT